MDLHRAYRRRFLRIGRFECVSAKNGCVSARYAIHTVARTLSCVLEPNRDLLVRNQEIKWTGK